MFPILDIISIIRWRERNKITPSMKLINKNKPISPNVFPCIPSTVIVEASEFVKVLIRFKFIIIFKVVPVFMTFNMNCSPPQEEFRIII